MSGLTPISTNINANRVGEPIGSDSVIWQGGTFPCINVCGVTTVTDVVDAIAERVCTAPLSACYTGQWINITTIPASGAGPGTTWTLGALGVAGDNVPQYMWTREGDLKLRGSFSFTVTNTVITTSVASTAVDIGLFYATGCLPAGFTASQSALIAMDVRVTDQLITAVNKGYVKIEYPINLLHILYYLGETRTGTHTYEIDLGGTILNLA